MDAMTGIYAVRDRALLLRTKFGGQDYGELYKTEGYYRAACERAAYEEFSCCRHEQGAVGTYRDAEGTQL